MAKLTCAEECAESCLDRAGTEGQVLDNSTGRMGCKLVLLDVNQLVDTM